MAVYGISGIWKDDDGVITHYAFHTKNATANTFSQHTKKTKAQAVSLLETAGNSAVTLTWSYASASWYIGETVQVVNSRSGKYLKSKPDNTVTDNLGHLIDLGFIF